MAELELELMHQFRPRALNIMHSHQAAAAAAASSKELGLVPTQRFLTLGHQGFVLFHFVLNNAEVQYCSLGLPGSGERLRRGTPRHWPMQPLGAR